MKPWKSIMAAVICCSSICQTLCDAGAKIGTGNKSCVISVYNRSQVYLLDLFSEYQPDIAYLTLRFLQNNTSIYHKPEAFQPLQWVWTSNDERQRAPFLKWHCDYPVLSLTLLKSRTVSGAWVGLEIKPPDCNIDIGTMKSNAEIAYALTNLITEFVTKLGEKYHYNNWCFLAENPGIRDKFVFKLGIHFGFRVEMLSYNCCTSTYHYTSDKEQVKCLEDQIETMHETTYGPYVIGLIAFFYCPILLLRLSLGNHHYKDSKRGTFGMKNGYEVIPNRDKDDEYESKSNFVYLDDGSPISFSSILGDVCGLGERHPTCTSRFRRAIFIILCPLIIYFKLYLYYKLEYEMVIDLNNFGVPTNFLSMFSGFEKSRKLFVPLIGGPYILLLLFHVLGLMFVILPENLGHILEEGAEDSEWADSFILSLGWGTIEGYSHINISRKRGFDRVGSLMIARFYCVLNPQFWVYIWQRSSAKFAAMLSSVAEAVPRIMYYFMCIFLYPLFALLIFLELLLCLLHYGVPLPWFFLTVFSGYKKQWQYVYRSLLGPKIESVLFSYCRDFLAIIFFFIVLLCFSYCAIIIFSASFNFLTEIIVFLFISIIVYPNASFPILFFGIATVYYFLKQLREIGETYFELLSDVVEVMSHINADPRRFNGGGQHTNANNESHPDFEQQRLTIWLAKDLLHYRDDVPGVNRDLFLFIVEGQRPFFATVFKAVMRIILIFALLFGTLLITSYATNAYSQVSEIMHVVFIIMIGSLPRALEVSFSGPSKAALKDILLQQLETTIAKYLERYRSMKLCKATITQV